MNITNKRQSQFELFPSTAGKHSETIKSERKLKDLTLTPENIIVLCIIFVMTAVLFFSIGVEKGKVKTKASSKDILLETEKTKLSDSTSKKTQSKQSDEQKDLTQTGDTRNSDKQKKQSLDVPKELTPQDDHYTIQVASFRLEKNAKREAMNLDDFGVETFVLPKGSHSIVCVGKFPQREMAKKFLSKLRSRYKDSLVRRL